LENAAETRDTFTQKVVKNNGRQDGGWGFQKKTGAMLKAEEETVPVEGKKLANKGQSGRGEGYEQPRFLQKSPRKRQCGGGRKMVLAPFLPTEGERRSMENRDGVRGLDAGKSARK